MKTILFITLNDVNTFDVKSIYLDLANQFLTKNNKVILISPSEKKYGKNPIIEKNGRGYIYKYKTVKATKSNIVKKAISILLVKVQVKRIVKRILRTNNVDIVIYATPPITLSNTIKYVKRKHNTFNYLMLKDIFPQNALDLRMLNKRGIKGLFYKYFRKTERQLYKYSDVIGVMSKKNKEYLLTENNELDKKIEVFPNTIIPMTYSNNYTKKEIFNKYEISIDKIILFYGGNLGLPQAPEFIKNIIQLNERNENVEIVIVGSGTEKSKIVDFIFNNNIKNTKIIDFLPKEEYEELLKHADAGLIFLDFKFTIPNYPSRILSYMNAGLPIIAATDLVTDIKELILDNELGYWVPSNNPEKFNNILKLLEINDLKKKGENAYNFFINNFTTEISYDIISKSYNEWKGEVKDV